MQTQRGILPAIIPESRGEFESLSNLVKTFSNLIHLDLVDGIFAPRTTWPFVSGQGELLQARLDTEIFYEVHLMTQNPKELGVELAKRGAKRIIGHIEAMVEMGLDAPRATLKAWRAANAESGISILFQTPLEKIFPLIDEGLVDCVQLMSISKIGFQGNAFEDGIYARIKELRAKYPKLPISIDGGVSLGNAKKLIEAGATRLVVGSQIMKAENPVETYKKMGMLLQLF